jgi:phage shock protein E
VRFQRITKEELKERLDRGDAPVLLDVRLKYPYEHSTVRLPGALRVMPDEVASVRLPPDREVVVYDSDQGDIVGARVAQDLVRKGHRVRVLKGGLPDWVTANYPTEPKEPRLKPAEPAPSEG